MLTIPVKDPVGNWQEVTVGNTCTYDDCNYNDIDNDDDDDAMTIMMIMIMMMIMTRTMMMMTNTRNTGSSYWHLCSWRGEKL